MDWDLEIESPYNRDKDVLMNEMKEEHLYVRPRLQTDITNPSPH